MTEDLAAPPRLAEDDRRELLLSWAVAADAHDELVLCDLLVDASGGTAQPVTSWRARTAVLRGEPVRALELLGRRVDETELAVPREPDDVTALVALATLGDRRALPLLVRAGQVPGTTRAAHLYLLALAAEYSGRADLATDAWCALADQGTDTPLVLGRAAAGMVARRDRTDADRAADEVYAAALLLRGGSPSPWRDPAALEHAATVLQDSGDPAGATLLACAVRQVCPPGAPLEEVVRRLRPRRNRWASLAPWLVALPMLAFGVLGLVAGWYLGGMLQRAWRRIPSWSFEDERLWFGIRAQSYDVARGRPRTSTLRPLDVLGAVLGAAVGTGLAAGVAGAVPLSTETGASTALAVVVWTTGVLGGLAAGALGGEAVHRARDRRGLLAGLEVDLAVTRRVLATCRCWSTQSLVGVAAAAYAEGHLRPAGYPDAGLDRPGTVLLCELSGARWLATWTASGRSALLLRGVPRQDDVVEPVATGLYL
ncbi:hypothetical protein [Cellulomonas sp. PSBB021]|uniref:hypothetical protein n=1 Tax=Cellulomonas sp. PSBB021 TaxID=2003551 RepID=UPI000B8DB319|nr:hypothetical protein [Cellulomonas sp. PSBB021]ASR55162.1 hypothetical protein CBP52_08810 [Cellulomonas sp. PSBB021]